MRSSAPRACCSTTTRACAAEVGSRLAASSACSLQNGAKRMFVQTPLSRGDGVIGPVCRGAECGSCDQLWPPSADKLGRTRPAQRSFAGLRMRQGRIARPRRTSHAGDPCDPWCQVPQSTVVDCDQEACRPVHRHVRRPVGRSCTRPDQPDPSPFRWPGAHGRGDRLSLCFSGPRQRSQVVRVNPYPDPLMCMFGPVIGTRPATVDNKDKDQSLD